MVGNQLLINDTLVSSLRVAMREGTFGLSNVPEMIKLIISKDAWKERALEQTGELVTFESFAAFVAAAPLEGLGTDLPTIKRLCRDDMEAVDLIDRATQRPNGIHTGAIDNVQSITPDGNSASAAIRRLRKDRPDLHAQVLAGELSAHAAAIEAGFRKRTITVPLEVDAAAAALRRHFSRDDLDMLCQLIILEED